MEELIEEVIEEAFRVAILTEKKSYDLYRVATVTKPDVTGEDVFKRLAREERKLIDELLRHCPDRLSTIVKKRSDDHVPCSDGYFRESPERRLFNHLRMALLDKQACIERYAAFVDTLREPAVCRVFELVLGMSRRQYAFIAEQCRQADLRLRRPAVNKRAKRTHIRPVNHPAPNRHSQLFISLLDSGSQLPF